MKRALKRAIVAGGGTVAVSRRLGVSHQAVGRWEICPVRRALELEQITGVSRYELRPDFYPRDTL